MFKLVAVGGKLRGKEFILAEGENVLGRAAECDHPIAVEGVSKKHLQVTVNGNTAFAEDLGSSNGTIVNGKIIKRITLKDGDKIALPNVILQVVYVLEKKVIIKKKVVKAGDEDDDAYNGEEQTEPMPASLIGKPIWVFKYKIMPIIYSFNQSYEWAALVGILLFIFIAFNITLTILPVLRDSKVLLIKEVALRGKQYAAEVDRLNNVNLRDKNLDQVSTGFLEGDDAEGVQSYKLFDIEGRVFRPVTELNTIVNDQFSVDAMAFYRVEKNQDREIISDLGNNVIGIGRAIKAHDKVLGRDTVVAIITLYFSPTSLAREASNNSKAYLESLITSAMVAIVFFGFLYYMTVKPLDELKFQIERVLRGRQKELTSKTLFKEIHPLRNTINSLLTRLKELQNVDSGETQTLEEDGPYLRTLKEFMAGSQGAVMILNSEKIIQNLNAECEDLVGIRENASAGQSILDTARDQGFAATLIDLCDKSANNEGCNQKEIYEIGGKQMGINVSALIGKDRFAKGFYITFVRND
ncbi:MAG TPA: FHA domain-containing protein [Bacteriovoracaceae bacterium]|nr:FHA domain-containing protein [Bacteriovoracaceae bacterium]